MKILSNIILENKDRLVLADLFYKEDHNGRMVIFCHGFKGFKDWGAWNLVAEKFAEAGFIFLKFNFSHNGVGSERLQEFTRLDLFEQSNYSLEIDDLNFVIKELKLHPILSLLKIEEVNLIGHSRGGGIALLGAYENALVAKVVTWASIASFNRFGSVEELALWKQEGMRSFYNVRTQQDMKIAYGFYEDYLENQTRLNIEETVKRLNKELLIIHGTADEAVGFSSAQRLKNWKLDAALFLIEKANHVFGAQHPYLDNHLPVHLALAVNKSIDFFNK